MTRLENAIINARKHMIKLAEDGAAAEPAAPAEPNAVGNGTTRLVAGLGLGAGGAAAGAGAAYLLAKILKRKKAWIWGLSGAGIGGALGGTYGALPEIQGALSKSLNWTKKQKDNLGSNIDNAKNKSEGWVKRVANNWMRMTGDGNNKETKKEDSKTDNKEEKQ